MKAILAVTLVYGLLFHTTLTVLIVVVLAVFKVLK